MNDKFITSTLDAVLKSTKKIDAQLECINSLLSHLARQYNIDLHPDDKKSEEL